MHVFGVTLDGLPEALLVEVALVELRVVLAMVDSPFVHAVLVSVEGLDLPVLNLGKRVSSGAACQISAICDVSMDADFALAGDHTDVKVDARGFVPPTHVVAVIPLHHGLVLVLKLGPHVPEVLKESNIPEHKVGRNSEAEKDGAIRLAEGSGG